MPIVEGRVPNSLLHLDVVDDLGPADERHVGLLGVALIGERHLAGSPDLLGLARAPVGHEADGPVVGQLGLLDDASIGLALRPDRDGERHRNLVDDVTRYFQELAGVHDHLPTLPPTILANFEWTDRAAARHWLKPPRWQTPYCASCTACRSRWHPDNGAGRRFEGPLLAQADVTQALWNVRF